MNKTSVQKVSIADSQSSTTHIAQINNGKKSKF